MINVVTELEEIVKQYPDISFTEEDNKFVITVKEEVLKADLLEALDKIYTLEKELVKEKANNIILNLKGLPTNTLISAISHSLKDEDLVDPVMILNITNLIKIYNTLSPSFFESKYVYVKDLEELLDLRMGLQEELDDFIEKLSIYFLSLLKSFNKDHYTPLDIHKPLPKVFKTIFLSNDLLTLSGIFAVSRPFSTDKCVYLDDGIECMLELQAKGIIGFTLAKDFIEGFKNGNTTELKD